MQELDTRKPMDPMQPQVSFPGNGTTGGQVTTKGKARAKGCMGMVADCYNLFSAVGAVSNSSDVEDWSWRDVPDRIDDVGVVVSHERRQVHTMRFREAQVEENCQICEVRVPARAAPGHDVQQICHVERQSGRE